jgi:hypothetical protein
MLTPSSLGVALQAGSSGIARLPPDMLVLTIGLAVAFLAPVAVAAVLASEGTLIDAEESTAPATNRRSGAERRSAENTESTERDRTIVPSGRSDR